jgi:hypothetical protein
VDFKEKVDMSLLKDLILTNEGSDLSRLPKDVLTAIKSNIRKGAEDLQQKWANALELVHKAYEVEGVQRPTPDMDAAWKQYEENLQYAVQQLASNRGMEDDWRMSSAMFREARQPISLFRVQVDNVAYITEGDSIDSIVNHLAKNAEPMDVKVITEGNSKKLLFSKWGIKHRTQVIITEEK